MTNDTQKSDQIRKSALNISFFISSHQVKPIHVDKNVAEESFEHFVESVGHQANKA